MYPNKNIAENLSEDICSCIDKIDLKKGINSRYHYKNVAEIAQKIASKTQYLNPEKAYVCGLLHDYGEFNELSFSNIFHGTAGYDEMIKKGYDEVAKTCLTHSFFENIYDADYFIYNAKEINRAKEIISKMIIDDYDRLIQLSDLLTYRNDIVCVEDRIDIIISKYKLPQKQVISKTQKARELKSYFDKLCNQDVYEILGIK